MDTLSEYCRLGIAEGLITHSTVIKGSTVTEMENQLLFDEGLIAKK